MTERITHSDIIALSDDLLDSCVGLDNKAIDHRVSMALDKLDAKHLDAVAHILAMAALVARRMANQRARQEDEEQEREHLRRQQQSPLFKPFDFPPARAI